MKNLEKFVILFNNAVNDLKIVYNNEHHKRKHKESEYFKMYLNFLHNSFYYTRYNEIINEKVVTGKYLNEKFNDWTQKGIIQRMFQNMIKKHIAQSPQLNLKYLSIDSQFVMNKCMGKKTVGRNIQYKGKNGCRISAIVDKLGMPLIFSINGGNEHDTKFLIPMMNKLLKLLPIEQYKNSKKYKTNLLADAGYHSTNNKDFLINNSITPVIDYNKRKTKDQKIIKKNKLTPQQKIKYQKRIIVENFHAWKELAIPRLGKIYDKKISSLMSMHYLAAIHIFLLRCV